MRYLFVLVGLLTGVSSPATADSFIVNTLADFSPASDANPGDGTCATSVGDCTLRAAIEEANASAGDDSIFFSVTGRILVANDLTSLGPLPDITETLTIQGPVLRDSGRVPGDTPPQIIIDGQQMTDGVSNDGLTLGSGADDSRIFNLAIVNFPSDGIRLNGPENLEIDGLYIGIDPSDDSEAGNGEAGIAGIASNSVFGKQLILGILSGVGNVISANGGGGLILLGNTNLFAGNMVGIGPDGLFGRGNTGAGMNVAGTALQLGIPGVAEAGNVIASNMGDGLIVGGQMGTVVGNRIGVDLDDNPNGNGGAGIVIFGDDLFIGSGGALDGNRIANNATGIEVGEIGSSADNNSIVNNLLGLPNAGQGSFAEAINVIDGNATNIIGNRIINANNAGVRVGTSASLTSIRSNRFGFIDNAGALEDHGNLLDIVVDGTQTTIGGTNTGDGNVFGFTGSNSIVLGEGQADVLGNYLGVTPGSEPIPIIFSAIFVETPGSFNDIGSAEAPNFIAGNFSEGIFVEGDNNDIVGNRIGIAPDGSPMGNAQAGIHLSGTADDTRVTENTIAFNFSDGVQVTGSAFSNAIVGNAMFENQGLGIDLGDDGITANDPGDSDTGPNRLMNFPEITIVGYDQDTATLMLDVVVDTAASEAEYPLWIDYYWHDRDESNQGRRLLETLPYDSPQAPETETLTLPAGTTGGTLRATATDDGRLGSTSELSPQQMFGFFDFIFVDGFEDPLAP